MIKHSDLKPIIPPQNLHVAMLAAASPFLGAAGCAEAPVVLPSGRSTFVLRRGGVIVKAHRAEASASDLNARLRLIAHSTFRNLFLQPLRRTAELGGPRLLTLWPAGTALIPASPQDVDWEGGARLLAALHRSSVETFARSMVPEAGWLSRLARARFRLLASKNRLEKRTVLTAFATLPPVDSKAWYASQLSFIHGDWHPGQVVHLHGAPRLIDIDDVGLGGSMWDLARPAAWHLAGFLPDTVWNRFLNSYREAAGPAILKGDPWTTLELPARAALIQDAANALARAERDERPLENFELELVNVCGRIVKLFS